MHGLIDSIRLVIGTFSLPKVICWYGGFGQNGYVIDIIFYVPHPGKAIPTISIDMADSYGGKVISEVVQMQD